jgi:predicted nucleic acid-binding protein
VAGYLLDTNHATRYARGDEPLTTRIRRAVAEGNWFAISTTVLGELRFGALMSGRTAENLDSVARLRESVEVLSFDDGAALVYGDLLAAAKRRGKPAPAADAHIAAVCLAQGLILLTADRHFALIEGLEIENWLDLEDAEA